MLLLIEFLSLVRMVEGIRECLHPVRLRKDENCEMPHMAQFFCHAESCRAKDDRSSDTALVPDGTPTDACSVVAHALQVDLQVFDVVLLPASSCQAEIRAGNFTLEDARRVLPNNEELVALRISGSQLIAGLEYGTQQWLLGPNTAEAAAEPKVAGIRYMVDRTKDKGERLSQAEILSPSCRWKPVVPDKLYHLLTTQRLAEGQHGYHLTTCKDLSKCGTAAFAKMRLADEFWRHLNDVCVLRDPRRRPIQSNKPMKPKTIRVAPEFKQPLALDEFVKFHQNQTTTAVM